jgi:hypothetical protein
MAWGPFFRLELVADNKKPALQNLCGAGYGDARKLGLLYPTGRRGARQHAQQATGMEHKLIESDFIFPLASGQTEVFSNAR